jgi:hypothetical protein
VCKVGCLVSGPHLVVVTVIWSPCTLVVFVVTALSWDCSLACFSTSAICCLCYFDCQGIGGVSWMEEVKKEF